MRDLDDYMVAAAELADLRVGTIEVHGATQEEIAGFRAQIVGSMTLSIASEAHRKDQANGNTELFDGIGDQVGEMAMQALDFGTDEDDR